MGVLVLRAFGTPAASLHTGVAGDSVSLPDCVWGVWGMLSYLVLLYLLSMLTWLVALCIFMNLFGRN